MDDQVEHRKAAGEAARVARVVRRLSQRELAQAAALEPWKLEKFERGLRPLTPAEHQRLWEALSS